jgi:hypothetical protein
MLFTGRVNMTARKNVILLVTVLLVLGFACQAAAEYYLSTFILQHRKYENGDDFNRITFAFKDSAGQLVTDDILFSAILKDPTGAQVPILELSQYLDSVLYGNYDWKQGRWFYPGAFGVDTGYGGKVEGALKKGKYVLEAVDKNSKQHTGEFYVNGIVNLPLISSKTLKPSFDKSGNLICQWAVPWVLGQKNPDWDTFTQAVIYIYEGKTLTGVMYVRVPTYMGRLFVPSSVLDLLRAKGSSFQLGVNLRTNDQNNRVYSNTIPLTL